MSDKTEEPTPRRLRKAREQGDSALSASLTQAVGFVVALAIAPAAVSALAVQSAELLRRALSPANQPVTAMELALIVIVLTAPLLAAVALTTAAASAVQTGALIAPKKLSPSLERLNPWQGLKQLFSAERLFGAVRVLAAAGFVVYFTWDTLREHAADIAYGTGELSLASALAAALGQRIAWWAAAVGLCLAGFDFLLTQRAFLRRQRMSKHEVKREHQESEGDRELKAARRRAHHEALQGASLDAMKNATVVIVNPAQLATALRYEQERDRTPLVLAQGQGDLAKRLLEAARAYGVPVVRDVPLARALRDIEVGDEIPEALYEAVAEILREAWASEARERATER